MIRRGLTDEMRFGQRLRGGKKISQAVVLQRNIQQREKPEQTLEARACLVYSKSRRRPASWGEVTNRGNNSRNQRGDPRLVIESVVGRLQGPWPLF